MTLFGICTIMTIMAVMVIATEGKRVLQLPGEVVNDVSSKRNLQILSTGYGNDMQIDGVTAGGKLVKGSCYIPDPQQQLPRISIIGVITLFPRQDCGTSGFTYLFNIWMGDSTIPSWKKCQETSFKAGWKEVRCGPTSGRKDIRITNDKGVQLASCKMEPYGIYPQTSTVPFPTLYTSKNMKGDVLVNMKYGTLLGKLDYLGKEYSITSQVCFDKSFLRLKWVPVLLFETRTRLDFNLQISLSVNGPGRITQLCSVLNAKEYYCVNMNNHYYHQTTERKCHSLKIVQFKVGSEYRWQFVFDNKMAHNLVNKYPMQFKEIDLYYGSDQFRGKPPPDIIQNLIIRSKL